MSEATALANMVYATPESAFLSALALAVSNDGNTDDAARYLLSRSSDHLRSLGLGDGALASYDFAIWDIEALAHWWPAFEQAASECPIDADSALPSLARFLADRLPVVWSGGKATFPRSTPLPPYQEPCPKDNDVTFIVCVADRIDTLVCLFAAGLKPNGSKDPFALRRTAKELLTLILPSTSPYSAAFRAVIDA